MVHAVKSTAMVDKECICACAIGCGNLHQPQEHNLSICRVRPMQKPCCSSDSCESRRGWTRWRMTRNVQLDVQIDERELLEVVWRGCADLEV
eukprot:360734-Chlamydomonas_euryale.AAC.2